MCSLEVEPLPASSPPADPPGGQRPIKDLEREICVLAAHIAAATCRWLLLLAEFDEREGWAEWGTVSCAHWLSWRCSIAPGAARERLRVARRLKELPLVCEAFAAGQLSYCKVRALTRVATPEIEGDLVEIARHATGAQLEKLVRGYAGALAVTLGSARQAHERRYLRWSREDDGSLRLEVRLPADEGALVLNAIRAAEETAASSQNRVDEGSEAEDPVGARRADALVTMARATLAGPAAERRGGDPCELVVHVDAQTLASDAVHECAQIEGGPSLAPETGGRCRLGAGRGRFRLRYGERSADGIGSADFRGARIRGFSTRTTSSTGLGAVRPILRTWSSFAPTTTGSFMRAGSAQRGRESKRFASVVRTVSSCPRRARAWRRQAPRSCNSTVPGRWRSTPTRAGPGRRGTHWTTAWLSSRCSRVR